MNNEPDILTIEEEGTFGCIGVTPTLTCEVEDGHLYLAVQGRTGHRGIIHLTQKQAFDLGYGVRVLADKLPPIRERLVGPMRERLMGTTLNQAEADHLIALIKTRVRE